MLPTWVADYIGIPFVPHGRTREGCDCYGLLRLVLTEQFGRELPLYDDYDFEDKGEEARLIDERLPLIGAAFTHTRTVGDIVLMRERGSPSHVGIYVGDDQMLHAGGIKAACLEHLTSPLIRSRIVGYYHVD
jgi:cell wall-associated NlpC family hydrolase